MPRRGSLGCEVSAGQFETQLYAEGSPTAAILRAGVVSDAGISALILIRDSQY